MNVTLQTIMISAKSKFGVLDATTNKWLNPKDKELLNDFVVGHSYNVELSENEKNGKVYVNISKIVGNRGPSADAPIVAPVFNNTPVAPVAKAPYKKAWTPRAAGPARDFDAEARGKSLHGLICAAVQSPKVTMLNDDKALFTFIDSVVEYGMAKLFPK